MKKVLLIITCLLFISSLYAFRAGTTSVGGTVAYVSYTYDEDADPTNIIVINPTLSYFLLDILCLDGLFQYVNASNDSWDDPETEMKIGAGGRLFIGNLYAGAGMMITSYKDGSTDFGATYLRASAGYLLPIVENVYLELAGIYQMGLGKYTGDMDDHDNKESELVIGAGISVFFNTGR